MTSQLHAAALVAVIALVTLLTRLLPFLLFPGRRQPAAAILYLGRVLPCAIMGMLVVYCLKSVSLTAAPYGAPELLGVLTAAALHVWRRNTLLSITVSTAVYMLLVQLVF